ncbi:hypothetical protein QTP86_025286, partial [Hemibagrus guttatus]
MASVTSYIGKCIDDVTVSKTTRSNRKPRKTGKGACAAEDQRLRLQSRCAEQRLRSVRGTEQCDRKRKTTPPLSGQVLCLTTADVRKLYTQLTQGRLLDQTTFLAECKGN